MNTHTHTHTQGAAAAAPSGGTDPRRTGADLDDLFSPGGLYHLHEGDCLTLLRSLPDASVDALITDPPYNSGGRTAGERAKSTVEKYVVSGSGKIRDDFAHDNKDQRAFALWASLWLGECHRVLKPGAPVLLFADWRQLPLMTDVLQCGGFVWRGIAAWDKGTGCRPTMGRFAHQCEFVAWGSKGDMPRDRRGVRTLPGVFQHTVRQADKHHMTGKPTPLMCDLVRIVEHGDGDHVPVVLDPFAGSGTTGVAAIKAGYRFVGAELIPYYAGVSRARLDEAEAEILSARSAPATAAG